MRAGRPRLARADRSGLSGPIGWVAVGNNRVELRGRLADVDIGGHRADKAITIMSCITQRKLEPPSSSTSFVRYNSSGTTSSTGGDVLFGERDCRRAPTGPPASFAASHRLGVQTACLDSGCGQCTATENENCDAPRLNVSETWARFALLRVVLPAARSVCRMVAMPSLNSPLNVTSVTERVCVRNRCTDARCANRRFKCHCVPQMMTTARYFEA